MGKASLLVRSVNAMLVKESRGYVLLVLVLFKMVDMIGRIGVGFLLISLFFKRLGWLCGLKSGGFGIGRMGWDGLEEMEGREGCVGF